MPFSVLQAFAVESATAFHLVTMRPSPAKLQRRQACSLAAFQHVLEVDKEILDEVVVDSKPKCPDSKEIPNLLTYPNQGEGGS